MWEMTKNTIGLFFAGKLFAEPRMVCRQLAIGVLTTAVVLVGLAETGAPYWLAALVAGLIGGAMQPYLFKDLRYR